MILLFIIIVVLISILFSVKLYLIHKQKTLTNKYKCILQNNINTDTESISSNIEKLKNTDKIIWSFWDNIDNIPLVVLLSIKSWKKYNPDYIICILNNNNLEEYVDVSSFPKCYKTLLIQHKSDVIRLACLEKYGGYWLDASLILTQPLSIVWEPRNYDIGLYYIDLFTSDKEHPCLETWFISAPKNSIVIKEWKKEFYNSFRYENRTKYIEEIEKDEDLKNIFSKITMKEYLSTSCGLIKVCKDFNFKIKLFKAEDGPFSYLPPNNMYNSLHGMYNLCTKDYTKTTPILKLRSIDRISFNNTFIFGKKNSTVDKILND